MRKARPTPAITWRISVFLVQDDDGAWFRTNTDPARDDDPAGNPGDKGRFACLAEIAAVKRPPRRKWPYGLAIFVEVGFLFVRPKGGTVLEPEEATSPPGDIMPEW